MCRTVISVARPAVAGALAALLFAAAFLSALHAPAPRDLEIGVWGPPGAAQRVATAVERAAPGTFDVRPVAGAAAAREAVAGRELAGAFLLASEGPELVVAGANGALATQAVRSAFAAVRPAPQGPDGAQRFAVGAPAGGPTAMAPSGSPAVSDVAPLPSEDRAGASAFFLAMATLIPGLLGGALVALGGGGPFRVQAAGLGATAMAVGVTATAVGAWVVGALPGAPLALLAITTALALAVGATVLGAVRLAGPAGMGVTALTFVALGVAAAGGPFGSAFVPEPFRTLGEALPLGVAAEAVRGAVYFDGAGVAGGLAILAVWSAAGLTAAALPGVARAAPRWHGARDAAA